MTPSTRPYDFDPKTLQQLLIPDAGQFAGHVVNEISRLSQNEDIGSQIVSRIYAVALFIISAASAIQMGIKLVCSLTLLAVGFDSDHRDPILGEKGALMVMIKSVVAVFTSLILIPNTVTNPSIYKRPVAPPSSNTDLDKLKTILGVCQINRQTLSSQTTLINLLGQLGVNITIENSAQDTSRYLFQGRGSDEPFSQHNAAARAAATATQDVQGNWPQIQPEDFNSFLMPQGSMTLTLTDHFDFGLEMIKSRQIQEVDTLVIAGQAGQQADLSALAKLPEDCTLAQVKCLVIKDTLTPVLFNFIKQLYTCFPNIACFDLRNCKVDSKELPKHPLVLTQQTNNVQTHLNGLNQALLEISKAAETDQWKEVNERFSDQNDKRYCWPAACFFTQLPFFFETIKIPPAESAEGMSRNVKAHFRSFSGPLPRYALQDLYDLYQSNPSFKITRDNALLVAKILGDNGAVSVMYNPLPTNSPSHPFAWKGVDGTDLAQGVQNVVFPKKRSDNASFDGLHKGQYTSQYFPTIDDKFFSPRETLSLAVKKHPRAVLTFLDDKKKISDLNTLIIEGDDSLQAVCVLSQKGPFSHLKSLVIKNATVTLDTLRKVSNHFPRIACFDLREATVNPNELENLFQALGNHLILRAKGKDNAQFHLNHLNYILIQGVTEHILQKDQINYRALLSMITDAPSLDESRATSANSSPGGESFQGAFYGTFSPAAAFIESASFLKNLKIPSAELVTLLRKMYPYFRSLFALTLDKNSLSSRILDQLKRFNLKRLAMDECTYNPPDQELEKEKRKVRSMITLLISSGVSVFSMQGTATMQLVDDTFFLEIQMLCSNINTISLTKNDGKAATIAPRSE